MSSPPEKPRDKIRAAALAAGVGHAMCRRDGYAIDVNSSMLELTGISPEEAGTAPWFLLDNADDDTKARRTRIWTEFIESGRPWRGLVIWTRPDGRIMHLEGTAILFEDDTAMVIAVDRTDEVEAQERERQTRAMLEQTLRDLPLAVAVTDTDHRVTYMNDYLPNRLDRPAASFHGKTLTESFGNRFTELARWVIENIQKAGSGHQGVVEEVVTEGGEEQSWLVSASPIFDTDGHHVANLNVAIDQTENRRLQNEYAKLLSALHEAQKVTALNDFAGSLAHELSNILHPVGFYARRLAKQPDHPDRTSDARRIDEGVARARDILRRTLTLSGGRDREELSCDVVSVVRDTVESAAELSPPSLIHVLHAPDSALPAAVRAAELRQVLVNLLNNAAEAMHYMGTITLRVGVVEKPDDQPAMIALEISDEGPGINPEIRERLFDPFVTTKPAGLGTGLGLSVVQKLVETWGGHVTIGSTGATGTAFCVYFPAGN